MVLGAVLATWLSVGLSQRSPSSRFESPAPVRPSAPGSIAPASPARSPSSRRLVGLSPLAVLGQPLSFVGWPPGSGGPSFAATVLAALVVAGSISAAQTAGAWRTRRAMAAADDRPGSGLPRSGPVVLAGVAHPREGTVAVPGTDAEALVYDAREQRHDGGRYSLVDLLEGLGGHELADDDLRSGRPFGLETERGDVVVDRADATLALHATCEGPARIESGDAVTVVGSIDRSGAGEASVSAGEGLCYVSDLPPGDLWTHFDRRVHRGVPVIALTTLGPVLVAAYLVV